MIDRFIYTRMVSWDNIASLCRSNPYNEIYVDSIESPMPPTVDRIPLRVIHPVKNIVSENHSNNETTTKTAITITPNIKERDQEKSEKAEKAEKARGKCKEIDPIVLNLSDTVELYFNSSYSAKKQLECEEAVRIESHLNDLYKSESGRSRGWTKVGLEALIQPRCASGGDIKELSKSNKAFPWPLVADDKLYSAFLDFICVAKQIRCAVWFDEDKHVVVFPAADNKEVDKTNLPLYNISSNGVLLSLKINKNDELIQYCDANGWILMPPASIFHTLSTLTLSELESVGTKLGCVDLNGNKKERIAKLASYKLRQRLLE